MNGYGDGAITGSSVSRMLDIFDVRAVGEHRFAGAIDSGVRRVVDGSQLLGQAIVATSKVFPQHSARSAHALFFRAVDDRSEVWLDVDVLHHGRTFAGAVVSIGQDLRRCASITVLLDVDQSDVIHHAADPPDVVGPAGAMSLTMPMIGRQVRLVGLEDPNDPTEVGPPVLDAWVHYDPIPERTDLAKALLAHFTGHLSISTSMRPHEGIGTSMAHRSVSTAVMGISITFHDPVAWDGWLLYHHESSQAGRGMSYVRGQVFTEGGDLIASFTQDGMIRSFQEESSALSRPVPERL